MMTEPTELSPHPQRTMLLRKFWDRDKAREQQRLLQNALNVLHGPGFLSKKQRQLLTSFDVPEWAHGVRVVPSSKGWVKLAPSFIRKLRRSYALEATDTRGH
jgi:hypothetical protein